MNGINVPAQYRKQLRQHRNRLSDDEKNKILREYITAREGRIITSSDFEEALGGLTTASTYVAKLVKKGRIKRTSVKNSTPGVKYSYKWVHGNVVLKENPVTQKREPIVVTGRTEYASAYEIKRLQAWFLDFMDKTDDMYALQKANVFRKFVMNGGELEQPNTEVEDKDEPAI